MIKVKVGSYLESQRSADGTGFIIHLSDNAPKWFKDFVHELHDNGRIPPTAWVYDAVARILGAIRDISTEKIEDAPAQVAYDLCDHATHKLYEWSTSLVGRNAIDEYLDMTGPVKIACASDWEWTIIAAQRQWINDATYRLLTLIDEAA